MVFDASKKTFDSLRGSPSNYTSWKLNIEAVAKTHRLWRSIQGRQVEPEYVDAEAPTAAEISAHDDWEDLRDQAAGMLWLCIEPDQQEHIKNVRNSPVRMWDTLENLHQAKTAAPRFASLINLLNVVRADDEPLMKFLARVTKLGGEWRELLPPTLSLNQLAEELQCVTAVRGISDSHETVATNILQNNVDKLTIDAVRTAFYTEDNRPVISGSSPAAMRASYTPSLASPSSSSSRSADEHCDFCNRDGHTEANCFSKQSAAKKAKERTAAKLRTKKEETAKVASRLTSSPCAMLDWIVDTGASRHMTSFRQLFATYKPCTVPVRLADDSVVYAEGVGSVNFRLQNGQEVKLTEVLHVPALRANLFSALFLVRTREFVLRGDLSGMKFTRGNLTLTARYATDDTAILCATVIEPQPIAPAGICALYATQKSTLVYDESLWHRRFAHLSVNRVRGAIEEGLVTGARISSSKPADPICEPCIAGKQHRHISREPRTRATRPLELIHSDLKGPMQVKSPEGYLYWVTFIDDFTEAKAVYYLRRKSETHGAFRQYKEHAEATHPGQRIAYLQNDGGGEYIGEAFKRDLAKWGIMSRETEPGEPHQNGVAERANRTLEEGATALLQESKLPPSLWTYAVSALTYCYNRLPTSLSPSSTPYHGWHNRKPEVGHLRIFGCLAYVLIPKKETQTPPAKDTVNDLHRLPLWDEGMALLGLSEAASHCLVPCIV
ncbi:Integrase catalytic domain-containing protein [Mycena sanguinolenta]|uniref:Integrase catalytic domain-containing protein n=1 Tax=Mycena sanguinolenta TaxID=230812 RepID=A0A8H6XRM8_9AGAR|nr:Integrase catalytic domain-containing protein [Mycena sanguinolenta]